MKGVVLFMSPTSDIVKNRDRIQALTKMSMCIALLCVSAYFAVPLPFTPAKVTLQTAIVNLMAMILSPLQALSAVGVYILIGICGLPVFSGGTAGLGILAGPTGGFIIGFLVAAPLMSLLRCRFKQDFRRYLLITILVGMPVIYLFGAVQMSLVNSVNIWAAILAAVAPFIIGDIIKCAAGSWLAAALNKRFFSRGKQMI